MTQVKVSPYRTRLDRGNAYWMARLAREVYRARSPTDPAPDEEGILARLTQEDGGFRSVTGADSDSAQAALIEHEAYLCLAFRGTDELADWLDNLDAFPVHRLFGAFHRGFWNALEDVWPPLEAHLRRLQRARPRPVFLTGHSLGGAMATLAAARFVHEDKPFTSVYTFGQPRAMSREAARIFNAECKSRFFRFCNNNDLVTRVPARMMGYSHVGCCLYITEDGEIQRDPGFWFRFVDHVEGALEALRERGIDAIEDHVLDRYLEAVTAWRLND